MPTLNSQGKVPPANFSAFLSEEFERRKRFNPRYSLRAFARMLDYDVSTLSKVLAGKRSLGNRAVLRLGQRLGLGTLQLDGYIEETYDSEKKRRNRKIGLAEPEFVQVDKDAFAIIADWYHYAILELLQLPSFRPSRVWIAKRLGLSSFDVGIALGRLRRAGLLATDKNGRWVETKGPWISNDETTSSTVARRWLQRQLLEKAIRALEEIPMDKRDQSSMTMAINREALPLAKKRIKQFRRDMALLMNRSKAPDEVYTLTISLFPLTRSSFR